MAVQDKSSDKGGVGELIRVIFHALILALIVRTFLFQPFSIPSGSMKASLLIGDYLFVSKYAYGYSRYSLPFGPPVMSGRVWRATPKRGDVVVFKLPRDPSSDYIKRVIGLPGDKIQMIDSVVHINGKPIKREKIADYVDEDEFGVKRPIARYRETLPNGVVYRTLDLVPNARLDNTPVYNVPQGHYLMMGDNRDNSTDSRVLDEVGYVPFENLVGRAEVIFFSIREGSAFWRFWRWPSSIRWGRMFTSVR